MGLRIAACIGWLSVVAAPVLMGACSSDVSQGNQPPNMAGGGSSSTGGTGSITTTAGTGPMTQACTEGVALANARLWRLTDAQYVNAVRQVFGVVTGPQVTEADSGAADYTNLSELTVVNDGIVGKYQTSAHDVARQAVKSHYATFMACDSEVCAQQFIRNRIARAFGRRLDDGEVTGYLDLFRKGLTQSPQDGVRLMIEAALQSPSFLYRTELGAPQAGGPTGQVTLTAHEVASLISFSSRTPCRTNSFGTRLTRTHCSTPRCCRLRSTACSIYPRPRRTSQISAATGSACRSSAAPRKT